MATAARRVASLAEGLLTVLKKRPPALANPLLEALTDTLNTDPSVDPLFPSTPSASVSSSLLPPPQVTEAKSGVDGSASPAVLDSAAEADGTKHVR